MRDWTYASTMRGEEWTSGDWLILRRRGDKIFNVFKGGKVRALAFTNEVDAQIYVERQEQKEEVA